MQIRQNNTNKWFDEKISSLLSAIVSELKGRENPPVDNLILINKLQDIIETNAPYEAHQVSLWLAQNASSFKETKTFFQTLFSKLDVFDTLKEIESLYHQRTNNNRAILQAAMESESAEAIQSFIQSGSEVPLDKAMGDLFKKCLSSEKYFKNLSILFEHLQSKYIASEIIAWIDENKINYISKTNQNPIIFFLAQMPWKNLDNRIFRTLKMDSLERNLVNDSQQTPLDVAVLKGNFNFVIHWCRNLENITSNAYNLAREHKQDSSENRRIFSFMKTPNRARKKTIIDQKPLLEITDTTIPIHPTQAICSQVYYEGDKQNLAKPLIARLNDLVNFEQAPLLAPLLYVFALAAIGKHRNGLKSANHSKFFKAVLSKEDKLGSLVFDSATSFGAYTAKNTLFVALGDTDKTILENIPIIFHEASHFVAQEVMQNLCRPYKAEDNESQQVFKAIVSKTLNRAHELALKLDFDNISQAEVAVWGCFLTRFDYPESRWEAELFVVFAQTISILGYDAGCHFIESNFPDFFNFYKDNFYPQCVAYLKDHQVQKYLDVGDEFLNVLAENPDSQLNKPAAN